MIIKISTWQPEESIKHIDSNTLWPEDVFVVYGDDNCHGTGFISRKMIAPYLFREWRS